MATSKKAAHVAKAAQADIPHIKDLSKSLKMLVDLIDHYENQINTPSSIKAKESFTDFLLDQIDILKKKVNELDKEVQKL